MLYLLLSCRGQSLAFAAGTVLFVEETSLLTIPHLPSLVEDSRDIQPLFFCLM